jgi:PhoPQ-activated pathogenicity-related protein
MDLGSPWESHMQEPGRNETIALAEEYLEAARSALDLAHEDEEQIHVARQLVAGADDLVRRAQRSSR